MSTAGTPCSCSYCSTTPRNVARSEASSAFVIFCLNRAMRVSLTAAAVGRFIGSIGCFVARSMARSMPCSPVDDEEDGLALAPGAARAADPVHVGLGVVGDVVVDHVADAVHVESPGGHVGGHEDVQVAVLQAGDRALALGLHHVAIERGGGEAPGLQALRQSPRSRPSSGRR